MALVDNLYALRAERERRMPPQVGFRQLMLDAFTMYTGGAMAQLQLAQVEDIRLRRPGDITYQATAIRAGEVDIEAKLLELEKSRRVLPGPEKRTFSVSAHPLVTPVEPVSFPSTVSALPTYVKSAPQGKTDERALLTEELKKLDIISFQLKSQIQTRVEEISKQVRGAGK